MRKVGLALLAVAAVVAFSAPSAYAFGGSCKAIQIMCPADPPANLPANNTHSVPEPATLTLLGAGVAAVGAALARRRRKSNTDK
jgi:hypothetical protein